MWNPIFPEGIVAAKEEFLKKCSFLIQSGKLPSIKKNKFLYGGMNWFECLEPFLKAIKFKGKAICFLITLTKIFLYLEESRMLGAIEAGGTKFVCAIGDEKGNLFERIQIPTTVPTETMAKVIAFF